MARPERSAKLNATIANVNFSWLISGFLTSIQAIVTNSLLVTAYVGFMFIVSTFVQSKI